MHQFVNDPLTLGKEKKKKTLYNKESRTRFQDLGGFGPFGIWHVVWFPIGMHFAPTSIHHINKLCQMLSKIL